MSHAGVSDTGISLARARLAVAVACHFVVDFFSFMVLPLLSVLEGRLDLTPSQGATLVAVQPLVAGLAQPVTAWVADRYNTRTPGVLGMALAVLCIGVIGYTENYSQLLAIYAVGCFGIGAFHPVAVACVGQLGNSRRSLAVSSFFVSGMAGGAAGSFVAPPFVEAAGIESLVYLVIPALACCALLAGAIQPVAHRAHDAHRQHAGLPPQERRARWRAIWLLYAGASLRSAVHAAVSVLVIRWAERVVLLRAGEPALNEALRERASLLSGPLVAALIVGMAMGGFTIGSTIRPRYERAFLILFPIVSSLSLVAFARLDRIEHLPLMALALPACVLMGVAFAGLIPMGVSLAQRIMPHRTSLVSGLMLGGSWAAGAWGPDFAQAITDRAGLVSAFDATAGVLALSGLISIALPRGLTPGRAAP